MADYGTPPYHESAARAALRMLQSGLAGLGSVPRGANFADAFLASAGGAARASSASRQAAQEYAMKQQEFQQKQEMDRYTRMKIEADIEASKKPPAPEKPIAYTPTTLQEAQDWERFKSDLKAKETKTGGAGSEVMSMSDAALTNAAKVYANTGQLPPMGMAKNASGLRVAIMEKAAKLYPDLNIIKNRANYAKDQRALTETQRLYDLSTAFEETASRNGQIMLEAAKSIPDYGNQFGNRIARFVANQTGSPAMSRFNAALETLKAEYAKILSSPGTAGGVLTDTARREMGHVIGGNQTKAQLTASLNLLRRDAANKRKSYAAKVREIQGRIGPASFGAQDLGESNVGGNGGDDVEWIMDENGNLVPK